VHTLQIPSRIAGCEVHILSGESNTVFYLCSSEPDCGMASWEAQKYFKQLISGVVSVFHPVSFLLQVIVYISSSIINKRHYVLCTICYKNLKMGNNLLGRKCLAWHEGCSL
jgi:hypothetical protein